MHRDNPETRAETSRAMRPDWGFAGGGWAGCAPGGGCAGSGDGPEPARQAPHDCSDLPALRVLVAEDDPVNQMVISEMLRRAGHSAEVAADGGQALELLAREDFDLVLMDVRMPFVNGVQATERIRSGALPGIRVDVPVVALTAYAMAGDRERFLAAGMNEYLSKPLTYETLCALLRRFAGAAGA